MAAVAMAFTGIVDNLRQASAEETAGSRLAPAWTSPPRPSWTRRIRAASRPEPSQVRDRDLHELRGVIAAKRETT